MYHGEFETSGGIPAKVDPRYVPIPDEWKERLRAYRWNLIRTEPMSPALNQSLEQVLADRVGAGERNPTIRFWAWDRPCVVLGRFQSVRNEVDPDAAKREGVSLVRRITGGGAMFIEPEGAITYSTYAPLDLVADLELLESYRFFDSWVVEALRSLDVEAWYQPVNDIMSSGGKIGGAAQARRGPAVLHHTTMAYDMNMPRMLSVLRIGKEKMSDRGVASTGKRVGPLRIQTELPRAAIIERFIETFGTWCDLHVDRLSPEERESGEQLAASKFASDEWTFALP
ncbi:MAG: biotin/lipoate A/B protein ligase family protein [Rectinemataceae bacterium]